MTLPLDQTEGFEGRRDFALPQEDMDWLNAATARYELVAEGNVLRVVLYNFPLPAGYNCREADVNVRIDAGYPDTQIDMVYVYPAARSRRRQANQGNFDRPLQWQGVANAGVVTGTRANPWRPGVDNLATHFGLVEHWFLREISRG